MHFRCVLALCTSLSLAFSSVFAASPPGWNAQNVGAPPQPGTVTFTEATGQIAITGPGHDLDGTTDNFQFICQPLIGDGEVITRVASFTNPASYPHAGLMLRASLDPNSAHVEVSATAADNSVSFRSRLAAGATTHTETRASTTLPHWMKIARLGGRVTAFTSLDGVGWKFIGAETALPLGETVYVGLAVSSTTLNGGAVSTFDRLTLRQAGAPPTVATASLIGANTAGSASAIGAEAGAFVLSSNGGNLGGTAPGFLFFQLPFTGDGEIRARVTGLSALGQNSNVGLMIRDSLAADALYASLALSTTGVKRQHLPGVGANPVNAYASGASAIWLKLKRHGVLISAFTSTDGATWNPVGKPFAVPFASSALFGLTLVGGGSGGSFAQANVAQVEWPQAAPPASALDPIVAAGLAAWRKPDANGIRCVDCHTPFAYDLAHFNFTRADVRLATTLHLPQADADAIFDMMEVLRAQYPPAGGLKDFRTFRPLQPGGGHIVGGVNATPNQRDAAFGFYLRDHFKLGQERIVTLAEARSAAQELIDVNVASVPVGIKFNLWSRSVLREGAVAGGEIAEWLPSAGVQPKPEFAGYWFALQDNYLREPSNENFWAIYHASRYWTQLDPHNFTTGSTHGNWRHVVNGQFRANALFTHDELLKARGLPAQLASEDGVRPFSAQRDISGVDLAPFWGVGDNARVVQNSGFNGFPRRNKETVHYDLSYNGNLAEVTGWQVDDLRPTWFWIGWMFDNSLRFSGEGSTLSGEYFIGTLWAGDVDNQRTGASDAHHGYRMHQVFFNAVHQFKLGFKPGAWRDNDGAQHFEASKGYYLGYDRWRPRAWTQAADIGLPGANALYKRLLSNHLRTAMLIHADEARARGGVYFNEQFTIYDLALWRDALHWADPEWTQADEALLAELKASLNPPLSAAETSDDDRDGQIAVVENALGTPAQMNNAATAGSVVERAANGLLAITFNRARADFTYIVEGSSDLEDWTVIATNPGTAGTVVTVEDTASPTEPRRFLRVRIIPTKV